MKGSFAPAGGPFLYSPFFFVLRSLQRADGIRTVPASFAAGLLPQKSYLPSQ
jgi:hypothetical protein